MKEYKIQNKQEVLIIGAGGHSKVTIDLLEHCENYHIVGILDDNPQLHGLSCFGYKIIGGIDLLEKGGYHNCVIAIGIARPDVRRNIFDKISLLGYEVITLVHPSAYIANYVDIGLGSMVMSHAVINVGTKIGKGVVVNTGAIVEHDCIVGDFVHIAPGAHLAGAVKVGNGAFIGIGATIIEFIKVGENAVIGSGAVVINDVPPYSTVVGNPARIIKEGCR